METAKLSSLKGKSGKGTGFVAKSIKYTNKYGEKRGFRFRYSTSKKMKAAKYKTTGLAKNTYTKTGLKKGKKYYVQVRYYYYDQDLTGPLGIVIGNEGNGMSEKVRKNCDFLVKIPMKGKVTSLNASVSTGIVIYEAVEQKLRKTID